MSNWRTIDSAPDELYECLLWCADEKAAGARNKPVGCVMGRFMFGKPRGSGMNGDWRFTHWQPLPAPPEPSSDT